MKMLLALALTFLISCSLEPEVQKPWVKTDSQAPLIYGEDDRVLWRESSSPKYRPTATATAAIVFPDPWKKIWPLKDSYVLCDGEKFLEELLWSSCTGVLIGPKTVLTAAHCVNQRNACAELEIYFDYLKNPETSEGPYHCQEIQTSKQNPEHDWALIILDKAPQRNFLSIRPQGAAAAKELKSFSHPLGLPLIQKQAQFKSQGHPPFFKIVADTFSGSSGSPLVNEKNEVVGILSRGGDDIDEDELYQARLTNSCIRFRRCDETTCLGETYFDPAVLPLHLIQ